MRNRGKPLLSKDDDDRCKALTVMTEWKRGHKRQEQCIFMAKWSVGENKLCSHHASMEAVAICIEKGYVKRLLAPPPVYGQRVRLMGARGK